MGWVKGQGLVNDFWEYNPEFDYWAIISDCPYVSLYGCAFSIDNKGYFGTGVFSNGLEFWEYTPVTTGIETYEDKPGIHIFPNPATEYITVDTQERISVDRYVRGICSQ